MEILWLITGTVLGIIIGWLLTKQTASKPNQNIDQLKNQLQLAEERNKMLITELQELKPTLSQEREKRVDLSKQLATSQAEFKNLQQRLAEQKLEMEQMNERFSIQFKNLANEILEEKSRKFTEQNKLNLSEILTPLKERISDFQKKVEDSNKEGAERNATLLQQIQHLSELNKQITKEAENLTRALKGDTKTQGNWGEVILERILEKSGLEKGREYETQVSEIGNDGRRYQPDVVVRLPENKHIIIDSKVSLTAYERYTTASSETERAGELKAHINSVRAHVKGLGEKNYQNLYGFDGLDFVLLFIPIEPAFTLAVQHDQELFNDAYSKNIVVVSPTTLIATLRTISSIWKQEYQNKNAIEIAQQSGALYDKFQAFTEDLMNVGKHLAGTQKAYQESMKKLAEGSGNLIRRAEKLKKLGAKASKQIDNRLLDRSED
ncbi:DNA recombination protein RmuC [Roseivirga sp. UBA838]|uniref:DNA recombination protein RmuC n=1 Tax=Roseivirga sp. UBA838 TaxID=1947393 RepID=UPI002580EA02|nr:DNA recombination protein RmuC [Roseivirga sp. UBA838]|tara:strand:+ start:16819 stop:18129 length:1311 start_codon:yes stop_codon:yes gene_type:complete